MAKEVIKKNGSREAFDSAKIMKSIELSAREAGLDEAKAQGLVQQIGDAAVRFAEGKEVISTSAIQEKILGDLDNAEPSVSAAWRRYDAAKNK